MTSLASVTITRLDSLTGIRAIAVALVFWHHANHYSEGWLSSGMVGVSLFYLLSGFVMAWTDREDDTAFAFYKRRFARIYPSYLVACVIAFAWLSVLGEFRWYDLSALTLMQSWVPNRAIYFAGSAVFWSLSVEVFFYLMFPLIRKFTRRMDTRGLVTLGVGAGVVSLMIATIGFLLGDGQTVRWAVVVLPLSRLPEFIAGVVVGSLMARGWRPRVPLWFAFTFAAAAVVVAAFTPYALSRYAVTLIPFVLLIIALAAADLRGAPVFTRWAWIVKLGVWSYCFYLLHEIALTAVVKVTLAMGAGEVAGIILAVPASVAAAWALHAFVERPAEKRLRPAGRKRLDTDS